MITFDLLFPLRFALRSYNQFSNKNASPVPTVALKPDIRKETYFTNVDIE